MASPSSVPGSPTRLPSGNSHPLRGQSEASTFTSPSPSHSRPISSSTISIDEAATSYPPSPRSPSSPTTPRAPRTPEQQPLTPPRFSYFSSPGSHDSLSSAAASIVNGHGMSPSSSSSAPGTPGEGPFGDAAAPSTPVSRRSSFVSASPRRQTKAIAGDDACRIMADHLYRFASDRSWTGKDSEIPSAVAIRISKRRYALSSRNDPRLAMFEWAIQQLNAECYFTFTSSVVQAITSNLEPDVRQLQLSTSQIVQVVDTMEELAMARYAQMACFIRLEGTLVIWCDKVRDFQATGAQWEEALVAHVWHAREESRLGDLSAAPMSKTGSYADLASVGDEEKAEKDWDAEKGLDRQELPRRTMQLNAVYTGLAVGLDVLICALLPQRLFREVLLDGSYLRLAICVALPFMFCVVLIFAETIVQTLAQFFLPIGQMSRNSTFYSGVAPVQLTTDTLPHMTVILPVYKEGLEDVLMPTIESVSKAIQTYELQGGTANILVCEDGLQLFDSKEVLKRTDYYERQNCSWVARHPKNRAGRFKKSSNMNVACELSLRVEDIMQERRPTDEKSVADWSQYEEDQHYDAALADALAEHEGRVWAAGNIRIGDYILMIDSDSRIPEDCFLDAASEMEQSPEVGILQHVAGTFTVGAGYFEDGIAFFTKCVNWTISWTVSNGSVAPFMGHSAFLRWSALQHQSWGNESGKIFSEEHVSEDFVLALNLLRTGYITRWATYSNAGFLEGVSLSCDDELNRWQKYAYGASEMTFNPIRYWFTKSPIAKLYRTFLHSPSPIAYKFSATGYIASYWAIAAGAPLAIFLYVVQGIFWDDLDPAFLPNFSVLLGVIFVFYVGNVLGMVVGRYRSQDSSLLSALLQHIGWLPLIIAFFSGLSFHLVNALGAHISGAGMSWGNTTKSLTSSTFFKELPAVAKRFWPCHLVMLALLGGAIVMATPLVPLAWRIEDLVIIFPAVWTAVWHILYPLVLNPYLMLFKF